MKNFEQKNNESKAPLHYHVVWAQIMDDIKKVPDLKDIQRFLAQNKTDKIKESARSFTSLNDFSNFLTNSPLPEDQVKRQLSVYEAHKKKAEELGVKTSGYNTIIFRNMEKVGFMAPHVDLTFPENWSLQKKEEVNKQLDEFLKLKLKR